jgi:hypothetical protein
VRSYKNAYGRSGGGGGGVAAVAGSILMLDGADYVWPGHGVVTPPQLDDWTDRYSLFTTDLTTATGDLTELSDTPGLGLLLRSNVSAGNPYYGAYKSAVGLTEFEAGIHAAWWLQAFVPAIGLVVEQDNGTISAGAQLAVLWTAQSGGTGGRLLVLTWVTGTFAVTRADVEFVTPPPFVRIRYSAVNTWNVEVSWLGTYGPWRVLYQHVAVFTPARVWIVAAPPSDLDAQPAARGVDVPWLHYAES